MTKQYVEFTFYNELFKINKHATDDFFISINNRLRIEPMLDMKQPTPIGGMMGYETYFKLFNKGLVAIDYKWELYNKLTLIQAGQTNSDGCSDTLNINLSPPSIIYKLRIFRNLNVQLY